MQAQWIPAVFLALAAADANRPVSYDGGAYGLVGMAIGAIIAAPLERGIRWSRPYQCMAPRGYARHRGERQARHAQCRTDQRALMSS